MTTYRCFRSVIEWEGQAVTTYGIRPVPPTQDAPAIPDISPDRNRVKAITRLLNRHRVSPLHLADVVEDLLP